MELSGLRSAQGWGAGEGPGAEPASWQVGVEWGWGLFLAEVPITAGLCGVGSMEPSPPGQVLLLPFVSHVTLGASGRKSLCLSLPTIGLL
jgi:hypothetical protein